MRRWVDGWVNGKIFEVGREWGVVCFGKHCF